MFSLPSLNSTTFSWSTALSLAHASKTAYLPHSEIEDITIDEWGFSTIEVIDVADTRCYIAQKHGTLLVTFRGSANFGNWLSNINIFTMARPYGRVHRGFYNAYSVVEERLAHRLFDGSAENIWVTGHSLGGALAALAVAELAERLATQSATVGVYTFGQPRLGNAKVAHHIGDYYANRFFRFVNKSDLVTRLPPGFRHVGMLQPISEVLEDALTPESMMDELDALSPEAFEQLQADLKSLQLPMPESADLLEQTDIATVIELIESTDQGQSDEMTPEGAIDIQLVRLLPSIRDHLIANYIKHIRQHVGDVAQ